MEEQREVGQEVIRSSSGSVADGEAVKTAPESLEDGKLKVRFIFLWVEAQNFDALVLTSLQLFWGDGIEIAKQQIGKAIKRAQVPQTAVHSDDEIGRLKQGAQIGLSVSVGDQERVFAIFDQKALQWEGC